ncbi:16S rRNA (guanine(966)-N(2))-methyltransferase RsmD [Aureimonas altamirensis]|uniref:16S rRNA (guanine(966)-N(2))-methyltransferase RsmD n=1 Tax=Aureimonas altamirensis TaxID=370622 RepID=UPI001E31C40C|nr:16S rRNA (guanine(966)-N(2))-methyltransferase RsmD [Aureimonas altamirensis]UHD47755.1 16S rRNA (guanine(966)-N(2))-methyltransferase RsmD [Aureimonas altamirensis]
MRIVAGEFKGRPLAGPKGDAIRPTSERHRGSLFDILEHGLAFDMKGVRVLDLFSGTGALGLEALSRGARACVFVEEGVEGRGLLRTNIEALGLGGRTKVFRRDATRLGAAGTIEPFDIVMADPPYGKRLGEAALEAALSGGWLRTDAFAVLEEGKGASFSPIAGFDLLDERDMGASVLRFLRVSQEKSEKPAPRLTKT